MNRAIALQLLLLLLWTGGGICHAQTPFRHLQHNYKLRPSASRGETPSTSHQTVISVPDLHPVRIKAQQASQHTRRRQRTAPQKEHYSSQELYLDIRQGVGMKTLKAQNRKMWSGK